MRQSIVDRTLYCLDEVLDDNLGVDTSYYALDYHLDEAAKRVLLSAPLHAINLNISDADVVCNVSESDPTIGYIDLPNDFLRLRSLRMKGWKRPVVVPITEDDPQYLLQFNPVTRGGIAKPVAALTNGKTKLEYFSVYCDSDLIDVFSYIPFTKVDDLYPSNLIDATAWLLASIVLSVMGDTERANNCTSRYNELILVL